MSDEAPNSAADMQNSQPKFNVVLLNDKESEVVAAQISFTADTLDLGGARTIKALLGDSPINIDQITVDTVNNVQAVNLTVHAPKQEMEALLTRCQVTPTENASYPLSKTFQKRSTGSYAEINSGTQVEVRSGVLFDIAKKFQTQNSSFVPNIRPMLGISAKDDFSDWNIELKTPLDRQGFEVLNDLLKQYDIPVIRRQFISQRGQNSARVLIKIEEPKDDVSRENWQKCNEAISKICDAQKWKLQFRDKIQQMGSNQR